MIFGLFSKSKKVQSDLNGELSIVTSGKKKYLNTANTNYSYGSLQKVMEYALHQIDFSSAKSVLVLGLGGGCVFDVLREMYSFKGKIVAVDIDPVIIELAANEFEIIPDERTEILCADAFEYVKTCMEKFDLVIVDLFFDNIVPDKFASAEFWQALERILTQQGQVIFNTLDEPATNLQPAVEVLRAKNFETTVYRHVEKTNKVLIASHSKTK